jgi:hypothetical protein
MRANDARFLNWSYPAFKKLAHMRLVSSNFEVDGRKPSYKAAFCAAV